MNVLCVCVCVCVWLDGCWLLVLVRVLAAYVKTMGVCVHLRMCVPVLLQHEDETHRVFGGSAPVVTSMDVAPWCSSDGVRFTLEQLHTTAHANRAVPMSQSCGGTMVALAAVDGACYLLRALHTQKEPSNRKKRGWQGRSRVIQLLPAAVDAPAKLFAARKLPKCRTAYDPTTGHGYMPGFAHPYFSSTTVHVRPLRHGANEWLVTVGGADGCVRAFVVSDRHFRVGL